MTRENQTSIQDVEIAVFAFSKDSQVETDIKNSHSYIYIYNMIELLMKKHHVSSKKIGFSGYKEDIAGYLSGLIELYLYRNIDISLSDDTEGFDPDEVPNNISGVA